jgi:acyl dehydratase
MGKYISDEDKKLVGIQSKPRTFEVERGDIRLFAQAIGDSNSLFNDEKQARKTRFGGMIAPPTFVRLLHWETPKIDLPNLPKRLLDGGSEWEFLQPIRPGDRITVVARLADLRETESRIGTMVVQITEVKYTNHFDELCTIQNITLINY